MGVKWSDNPAVNMDLLAEGSGTNHSSTISLVGPVSHSMICLREQQPICSPTLLLVVNQAPCMAVQGSQLSPIERETHDTPLISQNAHQDAPLYFTSNTTSCENTEFRKHLLPSHPSANQKSRRRCIQVS